MRKLVAVILVLVAVFSFAYVKNVIFFIGDGMGINHIYLTQLLEGKQLTMAKTPYIGLVRTYSANTWVTDSAAAGTALATGFKTNNGMIGEIPNGESVPSIAEILKKYGFKVGIAVTCRVTHATPATFYGHVADRDFEFDLAEQLSKSDYDVIFGGGYAYFLPTSVSGGKRTDGKDLISDMKKRGYTYINDRAGLDKVNDGKVIGLFAPNHLAPVSNRPSNQPSLDELTRKAIELLSKNGDPFFLMVEGSQIDWEAHGNDPYGVWKEVVELNKAVEVAIDFAKRDPNTLIIVTADHETGGLGLSTGTYMLDVEKVRNFKLDTDSFLANFPISDKNTFVSAVKEYYGVDMTDGEYSYLFGYKGNATDLANNFGKYISSKALVGWTTFDHTGAPVPLFAFGAGSENFTGWFDNTEIARTIARLVGCPLAYPLQKDPIITGSVAH